MTSWEWGLVTAGARGDAPPMEFEPFDTPWSNGIMARHSDDGRPLGHLHWHPDGEIDSITVHPDFQRMGIGTALLKAAQDDPETYQSTWPIHASNHMTNAGRAFAQAHGHNPADHEVEKADDDVSNWGYTAVSQYTPARVPYTGQNEEEMSRHLVNPSPFMQGQGWSPRTVNASLISAWPRYWDDKPHPQQPWNKRWHPNHPQHAPAPWMINV